MTYDEGYRAGLRRASLELREACQEHDNSSEEARNIVVSSAHVSAAKLLRSWAEGFDIIADNYNRLNRP